MNGVITDQGYGNPEFSFGDGESGCFLCGLHTSPLGRDIPLLSINKTFNTFECLFSRFGEGMDYSSIDSFSCYNPSEFYQNIPCFLESVKCHDVFKIMCKFFTIFKKKECSQSAYLFYLFDFRHPRGFNQKNPSLSYTEQCAMNLYVASNIRYRDVCNMLYDFEIIKEGQESLAVFVAPVRLGMLSLFATELERVSQDERFKNDKTVQQVLHEIGYWLRFAMDQEIDNVAYPYRSFYCVDVKDAGELLRKRQESVEQ